jgi:glycosyltransferase involved in cell wall biosynthesis
MPEISPLPPMGNAGVSLVLLARDNAAQLGPLVDEWIAALKELHRSYEILLVDDGSKDGTADLLATLTERSAAVRVFRHDLPRGDGASLRTALAEARQPLLGYALCDPGYRPAYLARLLADIDKVHLVSGYRTGTPVPRFWRSLGRIWRLGWKVLFSHAPEPLPGWLGWRNHLTRLAARALFGIRNQDVLCPFRLCRRAIFSRIPIQSDGPFVHIEILAKANFLGCYLGEEIPLGDEQHPTPLTPRPGTLGQMFRDGSRVFNTPNFGPVKAVFNLLTVETASGVASGPESTSNVDANERAGLR